MQKVYIPELFERIALRHLPRRFIANVIRHETLVNESHRCKDLIMDFYEQQEACPHIACLDGGNGEIKLYNTAKNQWSDLVTIDPNAVIGIVALQEDLYLIKQKSLRDLIKAEPGRICLSAKRFTKHRAKRYLSMALYT